MTDETTVVEFKGVTKRFKLPRAGFFGGSRCVTALDDVSFKVARGTTLGVVGESGSGKSTLARILLRLETPSAGTVEVVGQDLFALSRDELRALRRRVQAVFQDPYGSLNPRQRVGSIVVEPLVAQGQRDKLALRSRAQELLAMVGLPERALGQPVHEFSGGQRQRIAIARALSVKPELIVLDEPTSSLDVSIRAQILNILKTLQRELRISYVFIGHDLQTVRFMSTTLCVMYFGRIVEIGPAAEVFACPAHPYTGMLLRIARSRDAIVPAPVGEPPDPVTPPQGCAFRSRCQRATSVCETLEPPLRGVGGAHHYAACHNAGARVNSLAR